MNKKQKTLLINWFIFFIAVAIASTQHEWISENLNWLRFPVFMAIILVVISGCNETTGRGKPGVKLQEFIKDQKYLKICVAITTLAIIISLSYSFNNDISLKEHSGRLLLTGSGLLLLSLFIVSEYKHFKDWVTDPGNGSSQADKHSLLWHI